MATSFTAAQLDQFRRDAKRLGRHLSIPLSQAQARIAAEQGFKNWSLLAKHSEGRPPAPPASPRPVVEAPDLRRRYYLHGDVVEDDSTKCYCARCEFFVEPTHFSTDTFHQDGTDGERYLVSVARWQKLPKSEKTDRRRPDDAPNVLAAGALAAREAYEASRSPFHRWLATQKDRDDPVGDLATDALRDKRFPVGANARRELEAYVSRHGDRVVSAVRRAWREFSAQATETQK